MQAAPDPARLFGPSEDEVFGTPDARVRHEEWRHTLRTPGYSAFLSAVLMGAGQIFNGQVRRGLVFLLGQVSVLLYSWDYFYGRVVTGALASWFGNVPCALFMALLMVGGVMVWLFNIYDAYEVARFVSFIYDRHAYEMVDDPEEEPRYIRERLEGARRGQGRQAAFLGGVLACYTAGIFLLGSWIGSGGPDGVDALLAAAHTADRAEVPLNAGRLLMGLGREAEARRLLERALELASGPAERAAVEAELATLAARAAGRGTPPSEPTDPRVGVLEAPSPPPATPTVPDATGPGTIAEEPPPAVRPTPLASTSPPFPTPAGRPDGAGLELEYALERAEIELGLGNLEAAAAAIAPVREAGGRSGRLAWVEGELARQKGDRAGAGRHWQTAIEREPDLAPPYLSLAALARADGQAQRAEAYLRRALAAAPDDPAVAKAFVDQMLELGKAAEAVAVLDRALIARPQDEELLHRAFKASLAAGNAERAHEAAVVLAKAEFRDPEVYVFLARRLLARGKLDEARRTLTSLKLVDPTGNSGLKLEAEILAQARKPFEVVALLKGHAGDGDPDLALLLAEACKETKDYALGSRALATAIEKRGGTTALHKLAGILHKRSGDFKAALAAYEAALKLDPRDKEALYLAGYIHLREGDFNRAIERFEAVRSQEAGYGDTDFYLGSAYQSLGRRDEAIAALTRVAASSPSGTKAAEMLAALRRAAEGAVPGPAKEPRPVREPAAPGTPAPVAAFPAPKAPAAVDVSVEAYADTLRDAELAYKDRAWEKALAAYDRVLAIKGDHFRSYLQKGLCLRELGRRKEAVEAFQLARALQPEHMKNLTELGQVLVELEKEPEALAVFEEAIRVEPANLAVRYKLGVLYERRADLSKAEEQYQAIAWYHPEYVPVQDYLGNVYYRQHKYERAAAAFRTLLEKEPANHKARLKLALTLIQLDDREAARGELTRLTRELDARDPLGSQVREYLERLKG